MSKKEFVVDTMQLERLSEELSVFPKELRGAMKSSLTTSIKSSLAKIVPQYYSVDAKSLQRKFKVRDWKSYKNDIQSIRFEVAGERMTLSHFKFFPKDTLASQPIIEIIKGQAMRAEKRMGSDGKLKTPFVMKPKNGPVNVFIPTGQRQKKNFKREVLKSYRTVSVPQMLGHPKISNKVQDNLLHVFDKNLFKRIEKRTGVMQQNISKG